MVGMSSDVPLANGLPAEAQPWVRMVEQFMRDKEAQGNRLELNTEAAISAAGNAVVAAANTVQAQTNAQFAAQRIPATLDSTGFTVTPSTYFDASGTPWGRIDITAPCNDLDTDGNLLLPVAFQVWGRVFVPDPDPLLTPDVLDPYTAPPAYVLLASGPENVLQVNNLQIGVQYQIKVCAVSGSGAVGDLSNYVTATIPAALTAMAVPDAPTLQTGAGMLVVSWDGKLAAAIPPVQFRYVYAQVSPAGANTWTRMGAVLVLGGGSIQIAKLTIGSSYDVQLVAVDSLGVATAPSTTATITVLGVDVADLTPAVMTVINGAGNSLTSTIVMGPPSTSGKKDGDLWFTRDASNNIVAQYQWLSGSWVQQTLSHEVITSIDLGMAMVGTLDGGRITADTIGANQIAAGAITVNELSPTIGDDLDISANGAVTIIAGAAATAQSAAASAKTDAATAQGGVNAQASTLTTMQTYYSFGPSGAVISNPASTDQLALRSNQIEMLHNGAVVSYWNSGQMYVSSLIATAIVLGKHKLEADSAGTGTVVRAL